MFRTRSPRRWIAISLAIATAGLVATTAHAIPDDPLPILTLASHQPGDDWQEEYLNQDAARLAAPDTPVANAPVVVAPVAPVGAVALAWTLHLIQR